MNQLIEKVGGFGFIQLAGGYNSKLPITTTGTITGSVLSTGNGAINIYSGAGAPAISAAHIGDLYVRTDGSSTSTRLYTATNTSGTWTSFTSAA